MLLLHLAACGLFNSNKPVDTGFDTSVDTDTAPPEDTAPEVVNWTKYKVDTSSSLHGVYSSGQGVYIVGTRGQAWVGSATAAWTAVTLPAELGTADLNALWGSGAGDTLQLAIAADDGLVATYTAGLWTVWTVGTRDNFAIDGTSFTSLYVAGENGIQSFDGTAWTVESQPVVTMNAIWAYDGGAVAVGNEGTVMVRSATATWAATDTGRVANLYGVGGTSAADYWVTGDQGSILHSNGSSWTQSESGTKETLNAVYATTSGVLVVGNNGAALNYDGTAWTILPTDTNQNLYAVHGVSATNAWGVGNGGLAMQYKVE